MTTIQIESSPQPTYLLAVQPEIKQENHGTIFCSNLKSLPVVAFQVADGLLVNMMQALVAEEVEQFNENKRQLVALLKKHTDPITQWSPLALEFTNPDFFKNKHLGAINLDMVRLCSAEAPISLAGACLQGASLLCTDLSHANLSGVELSGADARFAVLTDVNLSGAALIETNLTEANLSFANLNQANLYRARLRTAMLKQSQLQEANLRKADLRNVDAYQANFTRAGLQQADLRDANLFMADLSQARLRHCNLSGANLGFASLSNTRMQYACLSETSLASARMEATDLRFAKLKRTNLENTLLQDVNLGNACLEQINLAACAEFSGGSWEYLQFDEETIFPTQVQNDLGALMPKCTPKAALKRFSKLLTQLFASH